MLFYSSRREVRKVYYFVEIRILRGTYVNRTAGQKHELALCSVRNDVIKRQTWSVVVDDGDDFSVTVPS